MNEMNDARAHSYLCIATEEHRIQIKVINIKMFLQLKKPTENHRVLSIELQASKASACPSNWVSRSALSSDLYFRLIKELLLVSTL